MSHVIDLRGRRCPGCGNKIARATSEDPGAVSMGDVTICVHCLQIGIFDHDLKLRPITTERFRQIRKSKDGPKLERALAAAQEMKETAAKAARG